MIEISDDENDNKTSDENIVVQNDTFTNMKREELVVDDANQQEDTNDISDTKKQMKLGRMPRRPKQYEKTSTTLEEGKGDIKIFVGHYYENYNITRAYDSH